MSPLLLFQRGINSFILYAIVEHGISNNFLPEMITDI
jgi:hypothetical protein